MIFFHRNNVTLLVKFIILTAVFFYPVTNRNTLNDSLLMTIFPLLLISLCTAVPL